MDLFSLPPRSCVTVELRFEGEPNAEPLGRLYEHAQWASHLQHPLYPRLVEGDGGRYVTAIARRDGKVTAYAHIGERAGVLARLRFGPVFAVPEDAVEFLVALVDAYRRRRFLRLEVQLYEPVSERGEWIAYQVAKTCSFTSGVDGWTTATVSLDRAVELSTNHRRNVEKARRLGLQSVPMTVADATEFTRVYVAMYRARDLRIDAEGARRTIVGKLAFLRETGLGEARKVCDREGALVGGLMIMREGDRAFYDAGASDPARRELPILHLGMLDAMNAAASAGCRTFDLGGYGFLASPDDQVGKINRFKDGFRPKPLFFTRPMRFSLVPGAGTLLDAALDARRRILSVITAARHPKSTTANSKASAP